MYSVLVSYQFIIFKFFWINSILIVKISISLHDSNAPGSCAVQITASVETHITKSLFMSTTTIERALRAVFLDKQSSYQVLLDKSDLMTLQNRRLQDTAILMYKVKHKLCPTKVCELFHTHCSPYNL